MVIVALFDGLVAFYLRNHSNADMKVFKVTTSCPFVVLRILS